MRKQFKVIIAIALCTSALCGCSNSSSTAAPQSTTVASAEYTLTDVCNWATSDIWNKGFCTIQSFTESGKSPAGETIDIDFTISNLQAAMEKESQYNDFINTLDPSVTGQKQLIDAWNKMIEQADILYKSVSEKTPVATDESYSFDTGLFKQYYDVFYKQATQIKDPKFK
ncbi:MAG: hypothetical protein Q4F95_07235 [Oscillospiraceae bacterium]|nr:hypothetical protein [Oscillospiraceae bacterium]